MKKMILFVSALICSVFITSCGHGGNGPSSGTIAFVTQSQAIAAGESSIVTLVLSNSTGVSNIIVSLASESSDIATVSPASCTLSTANPSCDVTVAGVASGATNITVTADGYTIASMNLIVTAFTKTVSTTIASFNGVTYGYVADYSNTLWQCPMNATGGLSGACTALTNSGTSFVKIFKVTFESFAGTTYGYVADDSSNLWQCPMNATGGFSGACTALTNSGTAFDYTFGVTFETFNGTTYGYVAENSHNLWQCPMNTTGGFSGACIALTNSGTDFTRAFGVTFEVFNGATYGYVVDNSHDLWQCPMNTTGGFSGACTGLTNSGTDFIYSVGITFKTFNGTTYGYVSDNSHNLWQCPMNTTGGFSGACTGLTNSGAAFNLSLGVTFETFNGVTYGYVADVSHNLWQCPMNETGGFSGACIGL